MKHYAQQFELPTAGESFALVGETQIAFECSYCGQRLPAGDSICAGCEAESKRALDAQTPDLFAQ